jgi:hypothetical protein
MLLDRNSVRRSYQRIFDGPEGEFVLQHLMKVGFVNKSTFVKGDPYETALNEGARRLVLSILAQVYGHEKTEQQIIQEQIKYHEDHMADYS